jgi:hypothetical protein
MNLAKLLYTWNFLLSVAVAVAVAVAVTVAKGRMLIPKWAQTLFGNGEFPNGNFLVCLPISVRGSPCGNGDPNMENIPIWGFSLNSQMGTNSIWEWDSD